MTRYPVRRAAAAAAADAVTWLLLHRVERMLFIVSVNLIFKRLTTLL